MYALKVQINNQPPVTGGANDLSVLSAILTCCGKLGPDTVPPRHEPGQDFTFRLGGLTSRSMGAADEHLIWLEHVPLKVGDIVTVQIVETENTDPVISGEQARQRQDDEREYFEHCKEVYFDLRGKYEPEG
jgi:hypothetical protein